DSPVHCVERVLYGKTTPHRHAIGGDRYLQDIIRLLEENFIIVCDIGGGVLGLSIIYQSVIS
ncbi:MAG: hypothetical protein SVR81_07260, partial [Chloroflexota bacterium]|nr:hypothetical protein [Chloroflexota bacterium]